jgi:hypothetical protein
MRGLSQLKQPRQFFRRRSGPFFQREEGHRFEKFGKGYLLCQPL